MLDAPTQVGNSSADADKGGKTINKNKKDGVINCPYFSKICDFLTDKNVQGILGLIRNAWSVLWGSIILTNLEADSRDYFTILSLYAYVGPNPLGNLEILIL